MNAGKKILIGFSVLVGIVILFGAIGKASQDKPRPEADICASGYDALDTDTRFECAKKKHLNAMTGGHPKAVVALRGHLKYPETLHVEDRMNSVQRQKVLLAPNATSRQGQFLAWISRNREQQK